MASCKECNMEDCHKLSCDRKQGINSVDKYLPWLLNNLHTLSDEGLNVLYYSVWAELSDRKFRGMFDGEEGE